VKGISIYSTTRRSNGRQIADNPKMAGTIDNNIEAMHSLRRRGLISAAAYQAHVAAIEAAIPVRVATLGTDIFAVLVVVIGCALAIPGVVLQEIQGGFFAAAFVEEAMKPAGVYILLLRWPHMVRGYVHSALLCGLAGLAFGLIESLIYVKVYFPDKGSDFVLFRFTVTPALHVVASFLVGLGLSRAVIDWAAGRTGLPKRTRNYYFAGAGLHFVYNVVAVALELTGVLEF
jgi:RsiW-degrading membrane proteinase PrsW (M82 family)